mmetsp:Transcript_36954/g.68199  ORF Transcript_36954/g.68199 Transcript_36954/m.68199 type:complete len:229 (-) Transcript_36954:452-1138(-)
MACAGCAARTGSEFLSTECAATCEGNRFTSSTRTGERANSSYRGSTASCGSGLDCALFRYHSQGLVYRMRTQSVSVPVSSLSSFIVFAVPPPEFHCLGKSKQGREGQDAERVAERCRPGTPAGKRRQVLRHGSLRRVHPRRCRRCGLPVSPTRCRLCQPYCPEGRRRQSRNFDSHEDAKGPPPDGLRWGSFGRFHHKRHRARRYGEIRHHRRESGSGSTRARRGGVRG